MNYLNLLYALSFVICGCYSMLPAPDRIESELTVVKNGPLIDRIIRKRHSFPLSGFQPYLEYNYNHSQATRSQSAETLDKEKFTFKYQY